MAAAAALLVLTALAGCTTSTVAVNVDAAEMHRKPILVLPPSRIAPTPQELQDRVVQRVIAGIAASPEVGPVTAPLDAAQRRALNLDVANAYEVFSNTLSLTGIPNGELAHRLGEVMQADLLLVVQPVYIPCSVCDLGDELWLVGQVVQASTGTIALREHLRTHVSGDDIKALTAECDRLTDEFVTDFTAHLRLRPHRERFNNLRQLAAR